MQRIKNTGIPVFNSDIFEDIDKKEMLKLGDQMASMLERLMSGEKEFIENAVATEDYKIK